MAVCRGEKGLAIVIPVTSQPEPLSFDADVRKPGLDYLRKSGITPNLPAPAKTEFKPCWRACLGELHSRYNGICAYTCIYLERVTGGISVDHFVAKSMARAELAYQWSNYRLASMAMNVRKNRYDDVLDPFSLTAETFHLELVSGSIFPNPALAGTNTEPAVAIARLGLDDPEFRQTRASWFGDYVNRDISEHYLQTHSPFVWYEAQRQGLL